MKTEHTFGGHALDRHVFDYEAIADAPVVDAPADVPEPVADAPVADAPVVDAPTPVAADPFAELGIDAESLRELAELAPMLRQALSGGPPEPVAPQTPDVPTLDPFAEDFGAQLAQLVQTTMQATVAPLLHDREAAVLGEAEERAIDILKDDATRNGEFQGGDQSLQLARVLADQFLPATQERYGFGPRAAEAALAQAASHVRELENQIGTAAVERYKNQLTTLADAPTEPDARGGAVTTVDRSGGDELDFARRYSATHAVPR